MTRVLLTGVVGFVGSHMLEHILTTTDWEVVGLARMSTVGDLGRLADNPRFHLPEYKNRVKFVYHDLKFPVNESVSQRIGKVDFIIHLGSNSHVDRSITHPTEFFMDNVIGAVNLLEWARLTHPTTRFLNMGTDEVFGPAPHGYDYKEEDRYYPSNPYSASKAGQLMAGISYWVTYKLPVISTHMMNIFGERQNKEKLVPRAVERALSGEPMTIHCKKAEDGTVEYVGERHWLHARNACDAILFVLQKGNPGERYNVVGDAELTNDDMVKKIHGIVKKYAPNTPDLKLDYVDFHHARPGHDRRYALDGTKIREMGWVPKVDFEESLDRMVKWTLEHRK
jgi:dTDP-glucose 4,6-dehydratase